MSMPPRFGWPAAAAAGCAAGAPAAGLAASAGFAASAGLAGAAGAAGAVVAAGCGFDPPDPYEGGGPALPHASASISAAVAPPTPRALTRKPRRVTRAGRP